MTAHTDPEDHTVTTPDEPEFNTGTGCRIPGADGWCVDVIGCKNHCELAAEPADAGGREHQAEEKP